MSSLEIFLALLPGLILLTIFIVAVLISVFPRKRKPKFWVEFNDDADILF